MLNKQININNFFKNHKEVLLLMLDYDGTLAPFSIDRLQAFPYSGIQERLNLLKEIRNARTVIISGRRLSDLEMFLEGTEGIELWGSHGLERKHANGSIENVKMDPILHDQLDKAAKICLEEAGEQQCELKPFGVALHWRGVEDALAKSSIEKIRHSWNKICCHADLEIHSFDGGIELRPKFRNKGDVVAELINDLPQSAALAYLGDDLTDEQAFEVLGNRGLKVLVRKQLRPTLADIQLVPPKELLDFLDLWIKSSGGK
jgi:trehalose 6-phosphate phosphatase